jgi:hypothetical protein
MSKTDHLFDFGFTAVSENELDIVTTHAENAATAEEKLLKLHAAIKPLLANLKKNPDKDYIKWPNRIKKVEEFEAMIEKIVAS